MTRRLRLVISLTTLALVAAACTGGDDDGTTDPTTTGTDGAASQEVVAQIASFDLAAGQDQRLLVGLFTSERTPIVGGEVQVSVGYLGEERPEADATIQMSEPTTAAFLPVPGKEPDVGDEPVLLEEGDGIGVYEAAVDLDQAGNWGAQVTVEVDGETHTVQTAFPVADSHRVPTAGDPAPRTDTPTIDDDVDPITLDSRAQGEADEVPDPELHDASVADVIDAGRPMVVVISTPVYCASQFCGPITDTIADLSDQYGDRAEFIHLEVWEDFESEQLNPAVEEWIFDPEAGGNEPWVFMVDADGTIQARWDNVLDEDELVGMLEDLPAS